MRLPTSPVRMAVESNDDFRKFHSGVALTNNSFVCAQFVLNSRESLGDGYRDLFVQKGTYGAFRCERPQKISNRKGATVDKRTQLLRGKRQADLFDESQELSFIVHFSNMRRYMAAM